MQKFSFKQKVRYKLDNWLVSGIAPILIWLALTTLLATVVAGFVIWLGGWGPQDQPVNFAEATWIALTRSLDPGTFGIDEGHVFRIIGLSITVFGVLIVAIIIGLVSASIDKRLAYLRIGRNIVVEKNHILILGWSSKVEIIISELIVANKDKTKTTFVVLADKDPAEMQHELKDKRIKSSSSKIIFRQGNTADISHIELVNPKDAKSIIIVSPETDSPDAQVVRTVLTLFKLDPSFDNLNVVAEFQTHAAASALSDVCGSNLSIVVTTEVISRITAQITRSPGLSVVYQDLLDFGGDEIYLKHFPELIGSRFGEIMYQFADSSIIGIAQADGQVILCPDRNEVIKQDDSLVGISEDNSTFLHNANLNVINLEKTIRKVPRLLPEKFLVLGWNEFTWNILKELDDYVLPGSFVDIWVDQNIVDLRKIETLPNLVNIQTNIKTGDTSEKEILQKAIGIGEFDHILILCYRSGLKKSVSDARTLLTLLQVRHVIKGINGYKPNLVTELLEFADIELASVADPDDYVISERVVALLLSQISEDPRINLVFGDLFTAGCAEIILEPISNWVNPGNFTVLELCQKLGDQNFVLIGIKANSLQSDSRSLGNGLVLHLNKNEYLILDKDDRFVLIKKTVENI